MGPRCYQSSCLYLIMRSTTSIQVIFVDLVEMPLLILILSSISVACCLLIFLSVFSRLYSAFWRQAGMSYLDYLSVSSKAVRNGLKEPARSKAAARGAFTYNKTTGPAGGEKVVVTNKAV